MNSYVNTIIDAKNKQIFSIPNSNRIFTYNYHTYDYKS